MTDLHLTIPPPELVRKWNEAAIGIHFRPYGYSEYIAAQAAQWGADQELDACSVLMDEWGLDGEDLMQCRRPKPLSEADQALAALREAEASGHLYVNGRSDVIRRALERLKELEGPANG